ncbi:MAG: hypothetical protein KDD42_00740 [Bdellovibrionales bacterium]|nr:hypothetical protein [Bdellovibrionales bacterium]
MAPSSSKGNDPQRWEKLLTALDEKLQLGLLDYLSRVSSYHFEAETLYIEPSSQEDEEYLKRDTNLHQLELLAQDAVGIEKVRVRSETSQG